MRRRVDLGIGLSSRVLGSTIALAAFVTVPAGGSMTNVSYFDANCRQLALECVE